MLKRIKSAAVIVTLLSGAAAAQPAPIPAPGWTVPDPDTLPDDAFGRSVRQGRDLIVKTSSLIGPDAPDPARHYSGKGLDCQSCPLPL
jgi:thiosulfate dehydrogenase